MRLFQKLSTVLCGDPVIARLKKRQRRGLKKMVEHHNGGGLDFKVMSQNGEDGILAHLTQKLGIWGRPFVEFGFGATESNTLFYAMSSGARGLYIDGSEANCRRARSLYRKLGLRASVAQSWIDADTINQAVSASGLPLNEVAILSIDLDGTDYWVWEAIDCIHPSIVIIEYNASFGPVRAVTIPYRRDFVRDTTGTNGFYHGMSLGAAEALGRRKGYSLICCDEAGLNASL